MITNLEHLKNAVAMLEEGGWPPGQELRILEGIETIVKLNMDRIQSEVDARVNQILSNLKGE
jgi:hypothetical protein